jgi:hypothetical protein
LFPFHHTAEYSIDEVVINSKFCLLGKSPRKRLVFATLLHLLVEVVDVNQNIQVPNKDKNTLCEPPFIFTMQLEKELTQGVKEKTGGIV